jgi:hypothetical protein
MQYILHIYKLSIAYSEAFIQFTVAMEQIRTAIRRHKMLNNTTTSIKQCSWEANWSSSSREISLIPEPDKFSSHLPIL